MHFAAIPSVRLFQDIRLQNKDKLFCNMNDFAKNKKIRLYN